MFAESEPTAPERADLELQRQRDLGVEFADAIEMVPASFNGSDAGCARATTARRYCWSCCAG